MKYKAGDEVVLRDDLEDGDTFIFTVYVDNMSYLKEKPTEISRVEGFDYFLVDEKADWMVNDYMIDHEKTAELHNHYQGELEKIVEQRNNDDYTKALMKYGRVEGDNLDAIKPKHYRQGMIDRIEVWYQTMPFEGFRWAMKSHIDKYNHRYEEKNGVEDLDKMMYFAKRLKEYELKEKEIERRET